MHQHKHHSYDFAINIMKFIRALEDGKLSHKYRKEGNNWFRNDSEFRSHNIVYSNQYSANYLQDVVMCFEYVLQFRGTIQNELMDHMYIRYLPMHKDENALLGSIYQRVREIECRDILDTEESYFQQSLITAPDSLQAHNLFNTLRQNISTDIFLSLLDYDTFVKDLEEIGL